MSDINSTVTDEEMKLLIQIYKPLNCTNRSFVVASANLLLASQNAGNDDDLGDRTTGPA